MQIVLIYIYLLHLTQQEMKFVIELFRHGARTRLQGPNPAESGELTAVGQRQHFLLGTQLRKEYIEERKFLSPTLKSQEFNVISTDFNRTIQSAQSQLLGLYPLGTDLAVPEFNNLEFDIHSLKNEALPDLYQPIPIHKEDESLFLKMPINTEQSRILQQQNLKTPFTQLVLKEQNQTLVKLKDYMGKNWNDSKPQFLNVFHFVDNMISDKYDGIDYPDFIQNDPEFTRNIIYLYDINFFVQYYQTYESQAYYSKPFYDFFKNVLSYSNLNGGNLKWQMLSAHDTNVALIQNTLNITTAECVREKFYERTYNYIQCEKPPRYTANLIFEFYEDIQKEQYLKVRYNGNYAYLCEKQSFECNLKEFQQRIENLMQYYPDEEYSKTHEYFLPI